MKRMVPLLLLLCLAAGCAPAPSPQFAGNTPPGQSPVQVGTVAVFQVYKYSGKQVPEQLTVQVDEYGNTILSVAEETPAGLSIYLDENARLELLATLYKARKLATEPETERIDSEGYVGTVVSRPSPDFSNSVKVYYILSASGQSWEGLLALSGYQRSTILTSYIGDPGGLREMRLILDPEAINRLVQLVEQAPGAAQQ